MENIIQIILKDINKTNEKIKENENKLNENRTYTNQMINDILKLQCKYEDTFKKLIKKIKKITLILSLSIIINSIAIILISLRG